MLATKSLFLSVKTTTLSTTVVSSTCSYLIMAPGINEKLIFGNFRYSTHLNNIITKPGKVRLHLVKSKTERYYDYAKFSVELCRPVGWACRSAWFLNPGFPADFVKKSLLDRVNNQDYTHDLIFKYLVDRCIETCGEKTMNVEIGRKAQPVSTNLLATEPFPPNILWTYVHVPEALRNKLGSWVNSSFEISVSNDFMQSPDIEVHSDIKGYKGPCWDTTKPRGKEVDRFDCDSKWILEKRYTNAASVTDMDVTVELSVSLLATGIHPDVFMPDYFTTVKPRPWTGEVVQVFSSNGDSMCCYLAALKCSSPVLEAQIRWNNEIPLTLELPSEVFEPFIEFINDSHVTAATKSFKLAVELLFAANKYDMKELQDKLLDLIYVQPLNWFDDTEALIELYLLLEVTRVSECVFERIKGIVKLKASEILNTSIYEHLDASQKSTLSSLISTYDVVLDIFSLWSDNRHASKCAELHANLETMRRENARIQAIHKRKPWQLCCEYLDCCNFKTNEGPSTELPDQRIKIVKTFFQPNSFWYKTKLVKETS